MLGDCLERMKEIPDGSVHAVISDLPYGTTRCKWDSIIPLDPMWKQVKRIIKPNGVVILTAQTPFDKVLGASNLPMLKYEWVWEKTAATGHLNAKKMPMKAHENILVFYDKPPTYNPVMTHNHERKQTTLVRHSSDIYGNQNGVTSYDSTSRYPRSVLKFSSDKQKSNLHPTQKPLALMEYLAKTYTNIGDVIADITMGSGTMGLAAIKNHRKFIGIELDPEYFKTAIGRITYG